MIRVLEDASPETLAEADEIIDVRSPSEFVEDHVPGAISLPVLSDAERVEVGTLYVQEDPFRGRRLGAALVARNIARHLEGPLSGRGPDWRPLVYCWRGGQRSNAMATVLSQVGWRSAVLRGGYKTYRRRVVSALYGARPVPSLVLLGGPTGAGKTALLALLGARGVQVLDLENLAGHRGSLLGALPGARQPSQKMFETRLAAALAGLDPRQPVVVEAEASKIGERILPPALWATMLRAPLIELHAPLDQRTRRLVSEYGGSPEQCAAVAEALRRLPRHIARADVEQWRGLLAAGELATAARELLTHHYDPAYARSLGRIGGARLGVVSLESGQGLEQAADLVCGLLREATGDL